MLKDTTIHLANKKKKRDKINSILAGCGFNIRKLLRAFLLWLFKERFKAGGMDLLTLLQIFGCKIRPAGA